MSRAIQTPLPTPIKGKADWRKFKAFRLKNGVTCLVVNDRESKTTAMSCIVEVGAASDPRELSGLAHFCEHMCFLGSEKYPGENEYKKYLASHGGRSNASTSMHLTNYKFEILADHAEKAIDIFSNFFVAPLFTSSGTQREVQAVSSENSKNQTSDGRRRLQILKDIADKNHYYSKFSTGNAETLPTNNPEKLAMIREALLAFHQKHYRPEKMTVVIGGPQSIELLEKWVGERYSRISNRTYNSFENNDTTAATTRSQMEKMIATAAKDAPPYAFDDAAPPYNPAFKASLLQPEQNRYGSDNGHNSWPVLLTTKPLRSMRKLNMMFPIPSDRKIPDRSPLTILSHLLGHEGVGSAFATLQNNGMLSSLSAGARVNAPDFTLFQIDMGLTEKGEEHWEDVVSTIFSYCRMLQEEARVESENAELSKSCGDLKRIWKEIFELDKIFFNETSPGAPYGYVPTICSRVVSYGTEACLSAGSMLNESEDTFPMDNFIKFTSYLRPENCIIERCSEGAFEEMEKEKITYQFTKDFGLRRERWYGVEYFLSPIRKERVSAWKGIGEVSGAKNRSHDLVKAEELRLPLPNRYIPRTLELCPELPESARKGQRIEKPIEPPSLIVNEENWKLFHRLDDRYALPKSSLHLLIRNMSLRNTKKKKEWVYDSRSSLLSSLLVGVFTEAMAQETYDASLAGLHWSISINSNGIKLKYFGFSDRLPDLALKVLSDFSSGQFLSDEKFFVSAKDRVIRGLRTYFESRRADSHALYYRDSLLALKDRGVTANLDIALTLTYEDIVNHHKVIFKDKERSVQCLYSGNVSSSEAIEFFLKARSIIQKAYGRISLELSTDQTETFIDPGVIERQLQQGEEIELHFSSQNPQEENGAVLCTYQSSIPSFKGETLSHPLALHSSSAIRLLCHIMREPLFDALRTKQQLGYIVSSSYEIGISSQSNENGQIPQTTPVDFISIKVLSQKMAPPDIIHRIDNFLQSFRNSLESMPESMIIDHANSLSTKLLKPTQKLQSEASIQYSRIERYGPEVFYRRKHGGVDHPNDEYLIPWNTTQSLASTIQSLRRDDLLRTFDRMIDPSTRSRVVSCVYGKKFPLTNCGRPSTPLKLGTAIDTLKNVQEPQYSASLVNFFSFLRVGSRALKSTKIVNNFQDLINHRTALSNFNSSQPDLKTDSNSRILSKMRIQQRRMLMVGMGIFGATVLGMAMVNQYSGNKRSKELRSKLHDFS